jgi:hypothetical protein
LKLDTITQVFILIGVVLNVVLGLARNPCDFVLKAMLMVVKLAMTVGHPGVKYNDAQEEVLKKLPCTLRSALKSLNIDGKFTTYAVCQSCHHTYPPLKSSSDNDPQYPGQCTQMIPGEIGLVLCGTPLLDGKRGSHRPIKPYVLPSFTEYLARLLSDPDAERLCDLACDNAKAKLGKGNIIGDVKDIFEADFFQTFEGPTKGKLYIEREGRVRLAFIFQVDFFSPNASQKRSTQSIGIISCAPLNLLNGMRYKPEFLYTAIIPGPIAPKLHMINPYIRPIIDNFVLGWERGFHLSRTSSGSSGRDVDLAIVLSANDLPAARKVSGNASYNSNNFMCTCCDCTRSQVFSTDWNSWRDRDVKAMRKAAEKYRDAQTIQEQGNIFREHGVRWSELWRLPYWDPTRMLVADPMHNLLEGLVHYHCRHVLLLDKSLLAKQSPYIPRAFVKNWVEYDPVGGDAAIHPISMAADVERIHTALEKPIEGPESRNVEQLRHSLCSRTLDALNFVVDSIKDEINDVRNVTMPGGAETTKVKFRKHLAELLVQWVSVHYLAEWLDSQSQRLKQPKHAIAVPSHPVNFDTLIHISKAINETTTPSWVESVPGNFGDRGAGSIKADHWRLLSTIYLPLALVTLWGDNNGSEPSPHSDSLKILDHTMSLFQAVILACSHTMTIERADMYRNFLKVYVDNLRSYFPHTIRHQRRTNIHIAFHVHKFLILFGPVMSWWCFALERLIGTLQKLNTNSHSAGKPNSHQH